MKKAAILALLVAGGSMLHAPDARACGAAYPGGPVMCDFPSRPGATKTPPPILRLSTSYAFTSTTILFGGDKRADLTRHAVFGSMEVPLGGRFTGQLGAGGIAGGTLVHGASRDTMGPGFAGYVGVAARVLDGRGAAPFVQLTGAFSSTHAITHAGRDTPRFTAFDLRLGAIAGKTIGEIFTPYAVGRIFGGPILWRYDGESVTGTDLYKYQVGAGLSLALFDRRLDVFAEGVPLGERGVAAGIGTTFF